MLICDFNGDDVGTALFHFECQEAAGGTDLQNSLTDKIDVAEVLIYSTAQIPISTLDNPVTWEFHCVVEETIGDIFHVAWRHKNLLVGHG
jgi:hypothetical protein